ncbi:hypothetical protein SRHO_G00190100 [Serrasalmus rhombeus]
MQVRAEWAAPRSQGTNSLHGVLLFDVLTSSPVAPRSLVRPPLRDTVALSYEFSFSSVHYAPLINRHADTALPAAGIAPERQRAARSSAARDKAPSEQHTIHILSLWAPYVSR